MGVREDVEELLRLGGILDARPPRLGGRTVAGFLAETLLRVRSREGALAPLRMNGAQRMFEAKRGQKNIVLKARQMGISTWVTARLFLRAVTTPGTLCVQVAHTQDAAESIFGMAHRFLAQLPEFLREGALRTSRLNAQEMYFPELQSGFRVQSASDPNAGRGLTITSLHCSEVARWGRDAREVLQGLKAALVPKGELVLESTPLGAEGCFWEEWQRARETGTVRHFFPWWLERSYVTEPVAEGSLSEEERGLRAAHGLTLEQVGFRRALQAGYRQLAKQEFAEDAESCFAASGACVFEVERLDARLAELPAPVAREKNGTMLTWLRPVAGRRYVVAVDTAGGGAEGDSAVAQVMDLETGMQCAELCAKLPVRETAAEAARLHREYGGAWVVVERNNHGSGVLAHLAGMMDGEKIYRAGGQEGWLTSAATRPAMVGLLGAVLAERPQLFMSERLLRECRGFVRLANGKTGAKNGAHDDCVMAMAMAHAVRAELLGRRAGRS